MPSAESIKAKLKAYAKATRQDQGILIKRYGREGILRRVAMHDRGDAFVLKGAMLFVLTDQARPTMDVDMGVRFSEGDLDGLQRLMGDILAVDAGDGIEFDMATMSCKHVRKDSEGDLRGIKVEIGFRFGSAAERALMDVQIWSTPMPDLPPPQEYPSLLPGIVSAPRIRMMPWEYVVTEKICASVEDRGVTTVRVKDAYDIGCLLPYLDGAALAEALENGFRERLGYYPSSTQVPILTDAYVAANAKTYADWARGKKMVDVPPLADSIARMRAMIGPLVDSIHVAMENSNGTVAGFGGGGR